MSKFIFSPCVASDNLIIPDLYVIKPQVFGDNRGYFMETWNERSFAEQCLNSTFNNIKFVQDNESKSKKGVLRGLHFQKYHPQGKLVRVIDGEVFDVAVDLRSSSATFGAYYGVILSSSNKIQLFIPAGFAHGFLVLSDSATFTYKCTDYYHPEDEGGLIWNDPTIGIQWPLHGISEILISEKDKNNPKFRDLEFAF